MTNTLRSKCRYTRYNLFQFLKSPRNGQSASAASFPFPANFPPTKPKPRNLESFASSVKHLSLQRNDGDPAPKQIRNHSDSGPVGLSQLGCASPVDLVHTLRVQTTNERSARGQGSPGNSPRDLAVSFTLVQNAGRPVPCKPVLI